MSDTIDLSVNYCGIKLKNPFLLASAPPTANAEMMGRGFAAGWAGGVTKTLVMDASAIRNVKPRLASLSWPGKSRRVYALENIELVTDRPLEAWLKDIAVLHRDYPNHLVIASIMDDAGKPDGWEYLVKKCEDAGARMIEINMSCPHGMPERGMGAAIGQDPDLAARVTAWTVKAASVPVIAKMTPNITDVGLIAQRCVGAGADSISAINTVASIMGVDLETFTPYPSVHGSSTTGGMSGPAIKPIALKAVAALAQVVKVPISGIGGIYTWEDAAEFLLLGAGNVQVCTAVMAKGFGIIDDFCAGLAGYLQRKGLAGVTDLVGKALPRLAGHDALSREPQTAVIDQSKCIKCGQCFISCRDAGFQAVILLEDKTPVVVREKCDGCALCAQICPVWDCVRLE